MIALAPPTSGWLLDPAAARRAGALVVGGKAHALARIGGVAGGVAIRVPRWLVIPAEVLDAHLAAAGLGARVAAELRRLAATPTTPCATGDTAATLAGLVDSLALLPELQESIDAAVRELGPGCLAVRSSAVGEDGERHSFAGQLDSVLGPRDAREVAAAVRRCWRSALGARALDYRRRAGSLAGATRVAVIVQQLAHGERAGVIFTTDPVTGDPTRMRVSACLGLGEGLMSGRSEADEYLVADDGRELEAHVAHKTTGVRVREGVAVEERVPDEIRDARALDAAQLSALAAVGRRIADTEGGPRDIEWAIVGGEVVVLQARPITGGVRGVVERSGGAVPDAEHRIVWDNSNIQESYYGVTTPLTFSFASAAYASVYEQTMRALGLPEAAIDRHRPMLRNLLGLIRGRVYYNLNNWYRGLLLLPAFRRNKADMERMMGVEEPVDFVVEERLGLTERLRRTPGLARAFLGLLRRFATLDADVVRWLADFHLASGRVERARIAQMPLGELMALVERLRVECLERWSTPIVNDFHVMMASGRLRRLVARAVGAEVDQLMQVLLGGADVAASTGQTMLLLHLAALTRNDPALRAALQAEDGAQGLLAACRLSEPFDRAYRELLDGYGDRCMGELKLESRSLREDPAFVAAVLRNYLAGDVVDDRRLAGAARAAREAAENRVERALGVLGRRRFRRALRSARGAVRARESMRLARTRLFGLHRDIYRAVGARLHEAGRLGAPGDVFYLTVGELAAYWEGTAVSTGLAALAAARRAEFAAYERQPAPNRVVTTGAPYDALDGSAVTASHAQRPASGVLRGLGCSAGVAEGHVRVVTDARSDLALAGTVLVAQRTDPGWAPLFPGLAAIVVERGSLLSHSAVLARELGIPAVVAVPGVVELLREGERVRVDGGAGTIERLEAR